MPRHSIALVLLLLAAIAPARAADVLSLVVAEEEGRYTVAFDTLVDAPYATVYPMMLNPADWPKLSRIVAEARVLAELPGGGRKIAMTLQDCILFFCKTLRKVEEFSVPTEGHIDTLAVPAQSDFSYARERWHIYTEGARTRVSYQAEMVPSFYVPPLIGPYIIKTRMRSLLIHTIENLELLGRS